MPWLFSHGNEENWNWVSLWPNYSIRLCPEGKCSQQCPNSNRMPWIVFQARSSTCNYNEGIEPSQFFLMDPFWSSSSAQEGIIMVALLMIMSAQTKRNETPGTYPVRMYCAKVHRTLTFSPALQSHSGLGSFHSSVYYDMMGEKKSPLPLKRRSKRR